jgi:hypothetical protein
LEQDPGEVYPAPDLDYLKHFGRGLSREEAAALQDTKRVLILNWSYPKEQVWDALREANELTLLLAERTGGMLWDETTREIFTPYGRSYP